MNMTFRPHTADPVAVPASCSHKTIGDAAASYIARGKNPRYLVPIVEYFGDTPITEIYPDMVYQMADALYPGRKNATKNRQAIAPTKTLLYHAYEKGWRRDVIRLRLLREEKPERKEPAPQAWFHAFCRQCEKDSLPHVAAVVLFMATTGARVSEAVRLQWREVDLLKRQVVLLRTKTGTNSVRMLTDELISRFMDLRVGKGPEDRVFTYDVRQSVNQRIRAVCKRAGIKYRSSHACGRHSFADNAMAMGLDIKTVMEVGDWKSVTVFMGTYVHTKANALRVVADRFSQYDFQSAI